MSCPVLARQDTLLFWFLTYFLRKGWLSHALLSVPASKELRLGGYPMPTPTPHNDQPKRIHRFRGNHFPPEGLEIKFVLWPWPGFKCHVNRNACTVHSNIKITNKGAVYIRINQICTLNCLSRENVENRLSLSSMLQAKKGKIYRTNLTTPNEQPYLSLEIALSAI